MSGRVENAQKTEKNIRRILNELPSYVSDYYYTLSVDATPSSCEDWVRKIRLFMQYLNEHGVISLNQISDSMIGQYFHQKSYKQTKNDVVATSFSYRKSLWSCLNSFLTYAYKHQLITSNPMENIPYPNHKDKEHQILLTYADVQLVLDAARQGAGSWMAREQQRGWTERDYLIILLFVCTGMRRTALSEIDIDDIDFNNQVLHVTDKMNAFHEYRLNNNLSNAINQWLSVRADILGDININALFISKNKTRLSSESIDDIVRKYTQEALGFDVSPHKLRAACCSILYEQTGDIEFVRDAIGHASVKTTQRYIAKTESAKDKAAMITQQLFS